MGTKDGIQTVFNQAAIARSGRGPDHPDALLREMGFDPVAFRDWVVDDVIDTLISGPFAPTNVDGSRRLSGQEMGALIAAHVESYMGAAFLIGKGEIGQATAGTTEPVDVPRLMRVFARVIDGDTHMLEPDDWKFVDAVRARVDV